MSAESLQDKLKQALANGGLSSDQFAALSSLADDGAQPEAPAVEEKAPEPPVKDEEDFGLAEGEELEMYDITGSGGLVKRKASLEALKNNDQLKELFDRVNNLLGDQSDEDAPFKPNIPNTLAQTGLSSDSIEKLVFKYLLNKGAASGREISTQIKIPFSIIYPMLTEWKQQQLLTYSGAAEMGDYIFQITDSGRERGRKFAEECSYYGAAPVGLPEYLKAMEAQSVAGAEVIEEDLKQAFSDLLISESMFTKLGPAINSGRGMFLFGEPGNGKTSIAERITRCFGDSVWIPRTLGIDGDIIRLFDPGVHEEIEDQSDNGLFDLSGVDPRWVRITRPTIVAGGELTMAELEVTQNPATKICEAPLQLKSNCGTLVIDDFGRQTMPVDVLLNRWIVPLEKRYDYLNLPSGKKVQVPFDQLIVFSTNLEPGDLVDGAFLRRIPYKICVPDPIEEHFIKLFDIMAPKVGLVNDQACIRYLIDEHYVPKKIPFRNCQPRDLLLQVRNYSIYKELPKKVTREALDFAVDNYFSMMNG